MITFDFETEAIVGNPIYNPPRPVGVSIKFNGEGSRYLAWAHPSGNNCTWEEGKRQLIEALRSDREWLAHNAAFEAAILLKWFGVAKSNPLLFHDTQYLIFLQNPYAASLSLKPSAERLLGLPPDEQSELRDWILAHVPEATLKTWGAYIAKAPGDLVGKYAGNSAITGVPGDTDRTWLLYEKLMPEVRELQMESAYQREQRLMPILSESSRTGVRVASERLATDIEAYEDVKQEADRRIFAALGEFDLDKDVQLAEALDRAGLVTDWVLTPTGKRSVARKNLVGRIKDANVLHLLAYRGVLQTCLSTFALPWLEQAALEDGRVHPQWNQVRGDRGLSGDMSGTRTGRMSCKGPNLQNPPNDFEELVVPKGLPPMMHMRSYLLPEEGHVWVKRDFSAQEMRIMAHFAEGRLFEAFRTDPTTDPHTAVQRMIKELTNLELPRKYVKITGFGIMYGRGVSATSEALGISEESGKQVRDAYFTALPEVQQLSRATRRIGSSGAAIKTWGGRRYYREPDPVRDLSYKLLNYLVQGSAADQTKQAMIDWYDNTGRGHQLIAAVHDEINISVPEDDVARGMRMLREAMDADRFEVPFRSEGYTGPNWSELENYDDAA
jgi:DNA polymerase I-like protein with 3'-5' exonuclease and polymerase domains